MAEIRGTPILLKAEVLEEQKVIDIAVPESTEGYKIRWMLVPEHDVHVASESTDVPRDTIGGDSVEGDQMPERMDEDANAEEVDEEDNDGDEVEEEEDDDDADEAEEDEQEYQSPAGKPHRLHQPPLRSKAYRLIEIHRLINRKWEFLQELDEELDDDDPRIFPGKSRRTRFCP